MPYEEYIFTVIWTLWPIVVWAMFIVILRYTMRMRDEGERNLHLLYVVLVLLFVTGINQLDPLQNSEMGIRAGVLRSTPMGMCIQDVQHIINNTPGRVLAMPFSTRGGAAAQETICYSDTGASRNTIRSYLGVSRNFVILRFPVRVFWAFDENGRLREVTVERYLAI